MKSNWHTTKLRKITLNVDCLTWSNAEKSAKPSGELSLLAAPGGGGRDGPAPPGGGGRLGGGGRRGGAALFFGGKAGVGESEGKPL